MLGHEPVGVIAELGAGLETVSRSAQRVIAGAITPCGQCFYCLNGVALAVRRRARRLEVRQHDQRRVGGVPARARRARQPRADSATASPTKRSCCCPDIFSTGLSGAESGNIKVGDSVAVFAQGPIGLCATLGAKLRGASLIIGDRSPTRGPSRRWRSASAPTVTLNTSRRRSGAEIKRLTDGRGVDVAIEALGRQETFENALRADPCRAARCRASASIPASSSRPTRRSTPASATRRSSRRSVRAARNGCAG